MEIVLISDSFPPLRTSGAVQLRDLAREMHSQGHSVTVLVPAARAQQPYQEEDMGGIRVLRLRTLSMKDVGYLHRTVAEALMPFFMLCNLRATTPLRADGIIWYSPSIFHTPLVRALARRSGARAYLIIRDMFPEWALDTGLLANGPVFWIFRWIARCQFRAADVIGVQTPGNLAYLQKLDAARNSRIEVLENWLAPAAEVPCQIRVDQGPLSGRRIIVYAGNMGLAQGPDAVFELIRRMQPRRDVGFLFVGRGSARDLLQKQALDMELDNVAFHDEIDPNAIVDLYRQCDAGLVCLDHRHRSHNIPGKFLTYLQSGLPVMAMVNGNNDLIGIIEEAKVGVACDSRDADAAERQLTHLLDGMIGQPDLPQRCRDLFAARFSAKRAAVQIIEALQPPEGTPPSAGRSPL